MRGVIKSGDTEVMDIINYSEAKCSENTLKFADGYNELVDDSNEEFWVAEDRRGRGKDQLPLAQHID